MKQKYIETFMDWAFRFAENSESDRLNVGAVLVTSKGNPIAAGCNGTKPGYHTNCCELDDGSTNPSVNHAEINCLNKLRGTTMSAQGCILFVTHSPCYDCALEVIDSGIVQVYYCMNYRSDQGLLELAGKGVKVTHLPKLAGNNYVYGKSL